MKTLLTAAALMLGIATAADAGALTHQQRPAPRPGGAYTWSDWKAATGGGWNMSSDYAGGCFDCTGSTASRQRDAIKAAAERAISKREGERVGRANAKKREAARKARRDHARSVQHERGREGSKRRNRD